MKSSCLILLSLITCFLQAQKEEVNAPMTIRGSVGIPAVLTSNMFRTCFNGVYEADLSVDFRVGKHYYAGLGYQNTFLQNNKKVFEYYKTAQGSLSYSTSIMAHSAGLKLGVDKFFSKTGYMSYGLSTGVMFANYNKVEADSSSENMPFQPQNFTAPFLQPEMSVNFIAEKTLAFSVFVSYKTLLYKFDAKAPRFMHVGPVKEASNSYFMSWLTFGFGFTVLLNR